MERTLIKDLHKHIDEKVTIKGWLHTLRDQKNMQFVIIRDRTGLVQVAHYKKATWNWLKSYHLWAQNPLLNSRAK